jgi:hypothetical protein
MSFIAMTQKLLMHLLFAGMLLVTAVQAQSFSAKNFSGNPILDENGDLLSTRVGRVELWWGTNRLNHPSPGSSGSPFLRDGFFALGQVSLPQSENLNWGWAWVPITVNAWDSSVGESYTDAVTAGHGYASVDCYVLINNGLAYAGVLDKTFPGLRLVPPLPHLQMERDSRGFVLAVTAENGQFLELQTSSTPTGPWGGLDSVFGRGREVPLKIPLEDLIASVGISSRAHYFRIIPR